MSRILPVELQFELAFHPGNLIEAYLENEKNISFRRALEKQVSEAETQEHLFGSGQIVKDENTSLESLFLSSLADNGDNNSQGQPFKVQFSGEGLYDRRQFQARKLAAWRTVDHFRTVRNSNFKLQYPNLQAGSVESTEFSSPDRINESPGAPQTSSSDQFDGKILKIPHSASGYSHSPFIANPMDMRRGSGGLMYARPRQSVPGNITARGGNFGSETRSPGRGRILRPRASRGRLGPPRDYFSNRPPAVVNQRQVSEYSTDYSSPRMTYQMRADYRGVGQGPQQREDEPAVIVEREGEFEEQEILSESPEQVYYSVDGQQSNQHDVKYQNMVEDAEKEFLPEDESEKQESSQDQEFYTEELEACIMDIVEGENLQKEAKMEEEPHPQDPHPAPPKLPWHKICEEDMFTLVFGYLTKKELGGSCVKVCKNWYKWIMNTPSLWEDMDLSGTQNLSAEQLMAVGRRRPKRINLSWTGVSKDDIEMLLKVTEDAGFALQLRFLSLAGCHWSAVEALKSVPSSITELDLRWVQGCTDGNFARLIGESPRIKQLEILFLSGCEVGDATVRLIANQFSKIRSLDLSYCANLSNLSLEVLCAAGSVARRTLKSLNLAGCVLLDAEIFGHLQKMPSLSHLDLRACTKLTPRECIDFEAACKATGKNLSVMS